MCVWRAWMTLTPRYPYPLGGGAREGWIIYIYIHIFNFIHTQLYTHIYRNLKNMENWNPITIVMMFFYLFWGYYLYLYLYIIIYIYISTWMLPNSTNICERKTGLWGGGCSHQAGILLEQVCAATFPGIARFGLWTSTYRTIYTIYTIYIYTYIHI